MKRYKNEAGKCPYCLSQEIECSLIADSVGDNAQLGFSCYTCESSWDVVYQAVAVLNEYNRYQKEATGDE